ncbi:AroM family protein [Novibacillus thermophilus]
MDIIVLDCMGYSEEMRDRVKRIADSPVALSRSVVARAAAELV